MANSIGRSRAMEGTAFQGIRSHFLEAEERKDNKLDREGNHDLYSC